MARETPLTIKNENPSIQELWPEIQRKIFHLFPGFLGPAILYVLLYFTNELVAISFLLGLALLLTMLFIIHEIGLKKGFAEKVPFVNLMFRFMKREIEVEQKTFVGSFLYFGTIAFLLFFFHPLVALLAVLVSANADGVAAIIGQWKGHYKNPLNPRKTIEGTLSFILIGFSLTFLGIFWFSPFYPFPLNATSFFLILLINIVTAIAEVLPRKYYWDQVTVPLTYAILFQTLFHYTWLPLF